MCTGRGFALQGLPTRVIMLGHCCKLTEPHRLLLRDLWAARRGALCRCRRRQQCERAAQTRPAFFAS